jgi:anaerobic ribonucleoside-triphosphate reductase activating protein
MPEITFILESDCGRVTVETSNAEKIIADEIKQLLGNGTPLNCARPIPKIEEFNLASDNKLQTSFPTASATESIHLFRIYHESTIDGPGRRSVIQVAGCSILCPGCYIPETHKQTNGKLTPITEIISEIEKKSDEHDGVTILGGEPFDQPESLEILVENLKTKGYHLVIYSGYTLEDLLTRNSETIFRILARTDLLIDGPFKREMTTGTGEYRGSSNQRLIFDPIGKDHQPKT